MMSILTRSILVVLRHTRLLSETKCISIISRCLNYLSFVLIDIQVDKTLYWFDSLTRKIKTESHDQTYIKRITLLENSVLERGDLVHTNIISHYLFNFNRWKTTSTSLWLIKEIVRRWNFLLRLIDLNSNTDRYFNDISLIRVNVIKGHLKQAKKKMLMITYL